MKDEQYYPLFLSPVAKKRIWGGTRLNKECGIGSGGSRVGEAWILSSRKGEANTVLNGAFKGMTLDTVYKAHPEIVSNGPSNFFPLLIKLIDAEEPLSVQVHPDDDYAKREENSSGKTEAWHILDAEKGAYIVDGLKRSYSVSDLQKLIERREIENTLFFKPVCSGETYFIPSGHVHAIGKGVFLYEIQQNSDLTYRVYDYDRIDKNGKKRELHIKKALDVMRYYSEKETEDLRFSRKKHKDQLYIADCGLFDAKRKRFKYSFKINGGNMTHLFFVSGEGNIVCDNKKYPYKKGDSVLIPAPAGDFLLKGKGDVIVASV